MAEYIYKICSVEEWRLAQHHGIFTGSKADVEDGYIHFSSIDLLESTVAKHFANQEGVILEIDPSDLPGIVWEEARGGHLFPHLYSSFDVSIVCDVYQLPADLPSLMLSRK
tara:strand:+ start:7898 stop:8230 length:333 start_codon:yes stop_codon:yes gene_type:complete